MASFAPDPHPGQSIDAQRDFPLVLSIHLTAAFGSANTSTAFIPGIHKHYTGKAQRWSRHTAKDLSELSKARSLVEGH